jgi:putative oxidoreductase
MIFAVVLADSANLVTLAPNGGYALELQVFYLLGALTVMLLGAGRYSIGGRRWN